MIPLTNLVARIVEAVRTVVLVGIVLICTLITLIVLLVHLASAVFSAFVGLEFIVFIHTVGFSELINLSPNEAGNEFLGESMIDDLAYKRKLASDAMREAFGRHTLFTLVVFVGLEAFKSSSSSNKLMGEFALVVRMIPSALSTVDLLSRVLSFACSGC